MSLANSCKFTGTFGKDPEFKKTTNGKSSCKFSLAVNKRDQNGEKGVTWVSCTAYGATSDLIMKYCQKGSNVSVECEYSTWEHQNKYYHGFTCFQVHFNRNFKSQDNQQQQNNNQQQQSAEFNDAIPF